MLVKGILGTRYWVKHITCFIALIFIKTLWNKYYLSKTVKDLRFSPCSLINELATISWMLIEDRRFLGQRLKKKNGIIAKSAAKSFGTFVSIPWAPGPIGMMQVVLDVHLHIQERNLKPGKRTALQWPISVPALRPGGTHCSLPRDCSLQIQSWDMPREKSGWGLAFLACSARPIGIW